MKYNKEVLNRFLTEKVAIALRTQEEWDDFMELLESETDLMWHHGVKVSEKTRFWSEYESETQVACERKGGVDRKTITYAKAYYKDNGYEIIEFKELVKEKEMNLADKLRFLADRWEDGKDFYIGSVKLSINSGELVLLPSGIQSEIEINDLKGSDLKLAPQWTFTEDERVILMNLPKRWVWIARDSDGNLWLYKSKPKLEEEWEYWDTDDIAECHLNLYGHLFKNIQWSDEEPCEFRKYL